LPFPLATWGSGGRRFKSSRPDFKLETECSDHMRGKHGVEELTWALFDLGNTFATLMLL